MILLAKVEAKDLQPGDVLRISMGPDGAKLVKVTIASVAPDPDVEGGVRIWYEQDDRAGRRTSTVQGETLYVNVNRPDPKEPEKCTSDT